MAPLSTIYFLTTVILGFSKAQETDPTPVLSVGSWSYAGCANEIPVGRALSGPSIAGNMTAEICLAFCTSQDYALAGLEFGNECFCGNELSSNSTYGQTGCNMACTADSSQICGGPSRISVYENGDYIAPAILATVGEFSSLGCYTEGRTERTLSPYVLTDPAMTVPLCVDTCMAQGFSHAGVEYATECYCGNVLSNQTMPAPAAECGMKCGGDKKTFCGGPNRLVVYTKVQS